MASTSFGERFVASSQDILTNPFFWGGLGILLLLAGTLYVMVDKVIMPNYTRHGTSIEVPNVQNQPASSARTELQELGLRIEEQEGQYNPNIPRNVVVDQSPAPGTPIKPKRRVYLTLNRGEVPTVVLPDLSGTSKRLAQSRLEGRGLDVEVEPDSLPSRHEGVITRQSPAPGDTVDVGSTVSLWYGTGLGNEETTVPSVTGRSVANARAQLRARLLRPIIIRNDMRRNDEGASSDSEANSGPATQAREYDETELFVLRQGTSPDTRVRAGTEIRLYVTPGRSAVSDPDSPPADSAAIDSAAVTPRRNASSDPSGTMQSW
jgi:beta-lactam-binding protein with PASTA domain